VDQVSDRMNDVLAAIDAETAKCICGNPIPADGASLDYCSDVCQYRFATGQPIAGVPRPIPQRVQTGREINRQVADNLAGAAPYGAVGHFHDAMRENAATAAPAAMRAPRNISVPDEYFLRSSHPVDSEGPLSRALHADFQARFIREVPDPAERDIYLHGARGSLVLATRIAQAGVTVEALQRFRHHGVQPSRIPELAWELARGTAPSPVGHRRVTADMVDAHYRRGPAEEIARAASNPDDTCNPCQGHTLGTQQVGGGETRVMWVPNIADPNAPTAAELSQGIDLTVSVHTTREWMEALEAVNASISLSAIEFMEQVAAATGISALEAARVFNEFATAFDNEPLTGEEFRRRALEHQQQRGTGPAERRQRYPRDHGPRRHR
jgi:hypothetical protein